MVGRQSPDFDADQVKVVCVKDWNRLARRLDWAARRFSKVTTVAPLPVVDIRNFLPDEGVSFNYKSHLMASDVMETTLLKALAMRKEKCRFLEVGIHFGLTTKTIAEVAQECVALDIDSSAGEYSRDLPNVHVIYADSRKLDWFSLGKFDLIYIDGDHAYDAVRSDTANAFQSLNENGVIVWDDYANRHGPSFGVVSWIRGDVLLGILDGCPREKRNMLYHVSNTQSAIYVGKMLPTVNYDEIELKVTVGDQSDYLGEEGRSLP